MSGRRSGKNSRAGRGSGLRDCAAEPPKEPTLAGFDTDKFDALMASMIAGMQAAVDEEEAAEAEQAPLTVETACLQSIPRLFPGDERDELARAHKEDGTLVIITPKSLKENLRVAEMFVQASASKKPGDTDAKRKAVWAIDKLMDCETALKLVATGDREGVAEKEAVLALQERLHSDITVPVARGLIDDEIRDFRQHLHQHLKYKMEGNGPAADSVAHSAMQIMMRVSEIVQAFGSKEQFEALVELMMKKSAFISAIATLPGSSASAAERVARASERER